MPREVVRDPRRRQPTEDLGRTASHCCWRLTRHRDRRNALFVSWRTPTATSAPRWTVAALQYVRSRSIQIGMPSQGDSAPSEAAGAPTQFSRAWTSLAYRIFAQSPQAKGRVERAAGTSPAQAWHRRLRARPPATNANRVLESFLPRFHPLGGPRGIGNRLARAVGENGLGEDLCFKTGAESPGYKTVRYRWRR